MTCLETRRLLLAEPRKQIIALSEHLSACPACARLARRLIRLERELYQELQLDVPEALADRILLQCFRQRSWRSALGALLCKAARRTHRVGGVT